LSNFWWNFISSWCFSPAFIPRYLRLPGAFWLRFLSLWRASSFPLCVESFLFLPWAHHHLKERKKQVKKNMKKFWMKLQLPRGCVIHLKLGTTPPAMQPVTPRPLPMM
jgi:hypothetical protein